MQSRFFVYLKPVYCTYILLYEGAPGVLAPPAYPVPHRTIIEDWMEHHVGGILVLNIVSLKRILAYFEPFPCSSGAGSLFI